MSAVYLGPSAAGRWLKCTASPGYIQRNADRIVVRQSDAADEGVEAHDYAGKALELAGLYDYDQIPDPEMRGHVRDYVDLVVAKQLPGDKLIVETKYPLFYMPGRGGIVDAAVVAPDRIIEVIDLKYGRGVSVDAVDNVQMAIYAQNLLIDLRKKGHTLSPDLPMKLTIYQPRAREGEPIREWVLTVRELELFCEPLASTAAQILLNPNGGVFYPDRKVCRFCDAKEFCTAKAQADVGQLPPGTALNAIIPAPAPENELVAPAAETLSLEQLTKVLKVKDGLTTWLNDVEAYAKALLEQGKEVPGYKLVTGRSHRKWADEAEAARVLRRYFEKDQIFEQKLVSPSQAEKLIKSLPETTTRFDNQIRALITKPEGAPSMVEVDDPRPALTAGSDFTNLDSNTIDLI